MRVHLKGIAKATAKLATGERVTYYYAWRKGPRLVGEPGSPEFLRSYNEAIERRKTPPQGLMFTLIAEFKASAEFQQKIGDKSKSAYLRYLKMIEAEFGDMPIAALSDPEVRGEFKAWRDKMADTPRTADYAWTTLARVLSVAKDRGRIPVNPCERGGRLYDGDRSDSIWGEAEIGKLLSVIPKHLEAALMLALWTGQREGDLLRLPWSAYDGKHIRLRQSKGGKAVVIPVSYVLKPILDKMERRSTQILVTSKRKRSADGQKIAQPWTESGFRASWRKAVAKAGITGLTFHDLRGSAVVRLALAGATVPEIATFTGHSLKDVESILDKHYLGRDVKLAELAMRKLERNERRKRIAK
jgi:integrase